MKLAYRFAINAMVKTANADNHEPLLQTAKEDK